MNDAYCNAVYMSAADSGAGPTARMRLQLTSHAAIGLEDMGGVRCARYTVFKSFSTPSVFSRYFEYKEINAKHTLYYSE